MGGFLAKPKTFVENTFVKGLLQNRGAWIGLTQLSAIGHEKKWYWGDLSDPLEGFNDWATGEPNGSGGCGQLWEGQRGWDDNDCDKEIPFVCQLPVSD